MNGKGDYDEKLTNGHKGAGVVRQQMPSFRRDNGFMRFMSEFKGFTLI